MPPYACNVFPAESETEGGSEEKRVIAAPCPVLSDPDIVLITMKRQAGTKEDAYLLRLHNNFGAARGCTLTVGDASLSLDFGPYEVKTVRLAGGRLTEEASLLI